MNSGSRTFYDVLGVSPDTPVVVLKAAFRALAKEYHPDSSTEAGADPDRFIELQDAYAVLSDPVARSAYDTALREAMEAERLASEAPVQQPGSLTVQLPFAQDGGPLHAVHARLLLCSEELAAAFREAAGSGRSEEELLSFAEHMENQFLTEYFGDDRDVRALARLLLLRCRKAAVVELNELVTGSAAFPAAERRRALGDFAERQFVGEVLLLPWLRDRFAAPRAKPPVKTAGIAPPARRVKLSAPEHRPHAMRSAVRVFCWSCAMYFGLAFVSTMTN